MHHQDHYASPCSRRAFLRLSAGLAAGSPFALAAALENSPATAPGPVSAAAKAGAKVAIVPCRSYGPEVKEALQKSFDLLGGIGRLVKDKTVTVKVNLTGTEFRPVFGRPVGESFMTHPATALALGSLLVGAGARRVRFVESCNSRDPLEKIVVDAGWDARALEALGRVEFENTRNLGRYKDYAQLAVPGGGLMFSSFNFNRAYADTDVLISLAKLKNHYVCGVTLSLKNLFGITPNSLYGDEAISEEAIKGRGRIHDATWLDPVVMPGQKKGEFGSDPGFRVPRTVTDICGARPIHLAIIDGITSMSGGEGPWIEGVKFTEPGVLITGLNPVSTDAVGTAVMGYAEPRAPRRSGPYVFGDNHLLLAEQKGLGTAELSQIEVLGTSIQKARHPYRGWGQVSA